MAMGLGSILSSMSITLRHLLRRKLTIEYPDRVRTYPERSRGRIVLTRDPSGNERCVACYLCSAVCPVDCISLQAAEDANGRRYPAYFRINFSRCIYCGYCEEACPTYAIQLTPDHEQCEYDRNDMLYEKDSLLALGTGKYPDYDFYRVAGVAVGVKPPGQGANEAPPEDPKGNMP